MVCATSKGSDQHAHTRSLIRAFAGRLIILSVLTVKLLSEHHLEFLSLKGGCSGSSESTLVLEITCHMLFLTLSFMNTHVEFHPL